ncbi:MAG: hypothetical protein GTN40_00580 [Candidatus Aenigmarchaeota archaeon]|nr:hypothetical protein [Candidatus Aenigmarchaeota archaeon]
MRGLSAIVTLLLVLLILIFLTTLFWLFTFGTVKELTESGTERTTRTREILSTCMIVDSIHKNNIYIKNCGSGVIVNDSLNVFLDDEPLEFNMTPETIRKGEIGTITVDILGISIGDYDLKISNPSLQIVQRVESLLHNSALLALDFDEGRGTIAHDKSGYENDGTLYDYTTICSDPPTSECPKWVNGKFGKALEFDGIDDYVAINKFGNFPDGFTIEFWFNMREKGSMQRPFLSRYFSTCYFFSGSTTMYCYLGDGTTWSAMSVWSSGWGYDIWTHFVMTYETITGNWIIYRNGKSVETGSYNYVMDMTNDFGIGAIPSSAGEAFNGIIDSFRIYNKALTPDEILNFKMK